MIESSAQVGRIIRNAVLFNVQNWHGDMMNENALLDAVERLFELLDSRAIDYVLVGGIAILHYVEGRNTEDIDLILSLQAIQQLPEITITQQDANFARGEFRGLQIDVLLTKNPLFKLILTRHAVQANFMNRMVNLASVDGLLLLKMYALPSLYRQGNFARVGLYENDIATLIQKFEPKAEQLLSQLEPFLDRHDRDELQGILVDVRQRIARFSDRHDEAKS